MIKKYDVLIAGAGMAGVSCAYNCASLGLNTLLIEKQNYMGGDVSGALVVPLMKSDVSGLNNIFYDELIRSAKESDAQIEYSDNNKGWFNPILIKTVYDKIIKNSGADILYEAQIKAAAFENKVIKKVEIKTNMLSLPIEAKYYVDATGNASLSELLNCEFWSDTDDIQPASLRFIVSGIDLYKFGDFIESVDSDKNITTTYRTDGFIHLSTAYTWDKKNKWALAPYFEQGLKDGVLQEQDLAYFQVFTIATMPSSLAFNCPRLRDYDREDPFDYSKALIEAREAILRLHKFTQLYFPGFKDSYISNIAPVTGFRETKRVRCIYDYTVDDIIDQKDFSNPVVHSNYPIDIHSNTKDKSVLYEVRSYKLPVESIQSKNYKNLYAIGKIAGTDFKSQAALRVQSSCMSMGEGAAKSIALRLNVKKC